MTAKSLLSSLAESTAPQVVPLAKADEESLCGGKAARRAGNWPARHGHTEKRAVHIDPSAGLCGAGTRRACPRAWSVLKARR